MLLEGVDARLRKSGMCDGIDTPETDMTNRAPAVQTNEIKGIGWDL